MNKIGIIISREYSKRVRKKSFILGTILVPILFAALIIVPALIAVWSENSGKNQHIAVADASGVIAQELKDTANISYSVIDLGEAENVKEDIQNDGAYYALLQISQLDSNNNASLSMYSKEQINMNTQMTVKGQVNDILRLKKLKSYNIPELEVIMDNITNDSKIKTYKVDDSAKEEKETSVVAYMGIGYISSFMIYMFIFMFGSMVMRGVIEEKNNRIVEIIISSVKPVQLMIGKIVGIALVALTQFAVWIILTVLIVTGASIATGANKLTDTKQITAIQNTPGAAAAVQMAGEATDLSVDADDEDIVNEFQVILNSLTDMNLVGIVATFLIYFIFGYLLYAGMFAAIGSCVDNEADTQQLMLPVTAPLIIGLFIMLNAFQNPNSAVAVWGSIIPFTSPMVMVARFAYGVPAWQYILSVSLLVLTFLAMAWLSAKIYRIGILSYGKKASWKEIFKWLKFKN